MRLEQTIGQNLANMERKQRREEAKLQGWMNRLAVWITLIMIGIAIGYTWRVQQTSQIRIVQPGQWQNELRQETFVPYEYLGTFKPAHLQ